MSWHEDFSEADYQQYWNLTPDERHQMIQDEQTPDTLKVLLLYQQGKNQLDCKEDKAAIASFDQALAFCPGWPEAWTDRALALLRLGEYQETVDSCNHAIALSAEDAKAWCYRGIALYGLREFKEAADSCDRALELNPNDYHAWRTLSDSLNVQQRYEEAIVSYDRALDLKPDDAPAWGQRGAALQKLGRYEEAIASYDRLLAAEPDNYQLWYKRGLALRQLKRLDSAIANFDQALEIRPDFYAATHSKLFLLLATGHIWHYLNGSKSLLERARLRNDLKNVFDSFTRAKLPTLVVLALVSLYSTHSRATAITIASIFLLITVASDLINESRK